VMGIGMYLVAEVVERQMTGWATRGVDSGMMAARGQCAAAVMDPKAAGKPASSRPDLNASPARLILPSR